MQNTPAKRRFRGKLKRVDDEPPAPLAERVPITRHDPFELQSPIRLNMAEGMHTFRLANSEEQKPDERQPKRQRGPSSPSPEPGPSRKRNAARTELPDMPTDLAFVEKVPDILTTMGFPLPEISHHGIRPTGVPRYLFSQADCDMDDAYVVGQRFRDLLVVREAVDWECRRLGMRWGLLRKKAALEHRRGIESGSKLLTDESLLEDIRRLEKGGE
ncbi:hypothetical protein PDE_05664 [Penicillium oxalicum 114-2]|uniref:Uncharacterized protein n=2 Tax=Penicillium oxalicum TaxID=69781 RepID=S8B7L0_PENO1|nr:hypothetical protein PDE_05664 [Penicillium oxalicum 114-2]